MSSIDLNRRRRTIDWSVVPLLTFAGLVSSIYTQFSIMTSEANGGGGPTSTLLLDGLYLGLTIVTALWFYKSILSWTKAVTLLVVTVVANCSPLLYKYVPGFFWQDKTFPVLGRIELDNLAFFFPTALVVYIGFGIALFPKRSALRTVPIASLFATVAAITFAVLGERQRGSWFPLPWSTEAMYPLWQTTLAFFLGLTLWTDRIVAKRPTGSSQAENPVRSTRNGFITLGILIAYSIGLTLWTAAVVSRYGKAVHQSQARVEGELAQSLAAAPSRENLPAVRENPVDELLVMQPIAGWAPYASGGGMLPAENFLPSQEMANQRALRPQRYSYGASYTDGSRALRVNVTNYPIPEWAKYELRHIPTSNELIIHPDWVKKLVKFGNNFYQDGPYVFWPSGNNLVMLDCQGTPPAVVDQFLKAYLEKYPSSL
jgi:hypothetical protein